MFFFSFLTSVTSQDVINFWFQWIIFLNLFMFTNFNYYKLILFSLTRKFCQIMYTNVFNDPSQLKQWSHESLLLISFFWRNLTSRFLLIEHQYRSSPPEMFFWGKCFVSMQWICGGEPVRGCDFNKVAYAALWRSLFCMGVLPWFLLCICGTFFW